MEPGRPNKKRRNEVSTTSPAVAAEEEVGSVRQAAAGQGRENERSDFSEFSASCAGAVQ